MPNTFTNSLDVSIAEANNPSQESLSSAEDEEDPQRSHWLHNGKVQVFESIIPKTVNKSQIN